MARLLALAATFWLLGAGAAASAATIPGGFLSQPTGRSSCINQEGTSHCLQGHGLGSAFGIALDQAGQHAYVTAFNQPNSVGRSLGALAVLDRFSSAASLLQAGGPGTCFSSPGADGCETGRGLLGSFSPAVSPDGLNVYVATQNGLALFARDPATGRVSQLAGADGCINESGAEGCRTARMVQNASAIVVSPDGRYVYVAAYGPVPNGYPYSPTRSGVAVFARNPGGTLTQLPATRGCVAQDGASGCGDAPGVLGAVSLALTPDAKTLYVGAVTAVGQVGAGAVSGLVVDTVNGDLAPVPGSGGCVAEGPVADCVQVRGMRGVTSVVAPDNQTVYAVGHFSNSVALLRRSADGRLKQPTSGTDGADGCTSATGADGCATASSLEGAQSAIASHDGFHLYVGGGNAISVFRRVERSRLVQLTQDFGCIGENGVSAVNQPCFDAHGLLNVQSLAIDPLDRFVYAATAGDSSSNTPSGGVVTLIRNAKTSPLTLTARLRTKSCRARTFVVDLRAKSPLAVTIKARIDGRAITGLPRKPSLRLKIRASAYSKGRHKVAAEVEDVTGRVRNTSVSFTRCTRGS